MDDSTPNDALVSRRSGIRAAVASLAAASLGVAVSAAAPAAAPAAWLDAVKLANLTADGSKKRSRSHHGFLAQDVQALIARTGLDFGGFQDHTVNGGDEQLTLGYDEFIAPIVRAIQEQQAIIETQQGAIDAQQSEIAAMRAEIAALAVRTA